MPPTAGVTVLLPICRAEAGAMRDAYLSVRNQTWRDLEILLILNGADPGTARLAFELAGDEPRTRVLELPRPGLAAALNAGLRASTYELVARMDADDTCRPDRLERQVALMRSDPGIAAVGTAWDAVDELGNFVGVEHPPTAPERVRWKLLTGNVLCHGSMMLRRGEVLRVGGYDESKRFAQDYDLWLRMTAAGCRIANLPQVLYRYSATMGRKHHEQATAAAAAMTSAWGALAAASDSVRATISEFAAKGTWGGAAGRAALNDLEDLLDRHGPSVEGLMAWQWLERRARARDVEKRERLAPAATHLAEAGVTSVWLYGAGRHTVWLVDNIDELGVSIAGVVDDALSGAERCGFTVRSPGDVPDGAHVLLSSDAHEEALWEASLPLRARGVMVHRIYGGTRATAQAV